MNIHYHATIQQLGYPSPKSLYNCYKEYSKNGELHGLFGHNKKFFLKEKQVAVNHYLEYGRNYSRTVRLLGYLSREMLRQWYEELAPEVSKIRRNTINYTKKQKK